VSDFRSHVIAMSAARPNARVSTIVALALALEGPLSLDDAASLGVWAKRQPAVAAQLAAGERIRAIKELRALTGASLLQAKNAVDRVIA
jgi:ribosomal protein L7/L12